MNEDPYSVGSISASGLTIATPTYPRFVTADGTLIFAVTESGLEFGDVLPEVFAEAFAAYVGMPRANNDE